MAQDKPEDGMVWKIVTMAAAFLAAFVVQKLVGVVWKSAVGHDMPDSDDMESEAPIGEIAIAAAVTGAAAALARHYAVRGTKQMAVRAAARAS